MISFSKVVASTCLAVVVGASSAEESCSTGADACKNKDGDENVQLQLRESIKVLSKEDPEESALSSFNDWQMGMWCESKYDDEIGPDEETLAQACLDDEACQAIWWVPGWNAGKKCAEAVVSTTKYTTQKVAFKSASQHHAEPAAVSAYPYGLMLCPTADPAPIKTLSMNASDYESIVAEYKAAFDGLDQTCEGEVCPVADVAGCILRMAGHDFMDYHDLNDGSPTGGSDACTDMNEGDNAGLGDCLMGGTEGATIKQVYENYCDRISLADFVVISAEAAMIYTRNLYLKATSADRGTLDFIANFKYGRETSVSCEYSAHVLPDPSKSCRDVQRVFVDNMGLDWRGAAALMGVHTLGRASTKNSGFKGWWSDPLNSRRFNNNYFVSLYLKGWMPMQVEETGKWQWGYSDETRNETRDGIQMMLDSDFCLAWSHGKTTEDYEEIRADSDVKTCAWTIPNISHGGLFDAMDKYNDGKFCGVKVEGALRALPGGESSAERKELWKLFQQEYGVTAMNVFKELRAMCCNGCSTFKDDACIQRNEKEFSAVTLDTGSVTHPSGMAVHDVMEFANDEKAWMTAFLESWSKATNNGYRDERALIPLGPVAM